MIQGFSHYLDPEGTKALKNTRNYEQHIPTVYEATFVLERLLDEFTVQYCGNLDVTLAQTKPRTSRNLISTREKHLGWLISKDSRYTSSKALSIHFLIKSLLGKQQLGVMNASVREAVQVYQNIDGIRAKASIHREALHKVVILEVPLINIGSGEIEPGIGNVVSDVLVSSGYKHIIYSTAPLSIAALVNFGSPNSYEKAVHLVLELCRRINASAPTYIRVENSSLKTPIPFPLSITGQNHYCCIIDKNAAESIALIDSFLSFNYKKPEEQLLPEEQQAIDERGEADKNDVAPLDLFAWRIRNDFVVTRTFYTGINKLIGRDKNRDKIRKLLGYLLFSSFRDESSNLILSARKICILLYGDDKRILQNNFNLSAHIKLLDPFVTLHTEGHRYKDKKATILKSATYREDLKVLAAEEYKGLRKDLVWLSDGEMCRGYEEYKTNQQREKAISSELLYPCPIARDLMLTLNALPSHTFTRAYNNNIEKVLSLVEDMSVESKVAALWKLEQTRIQPVPIYIQSTYSNRLQALNSFPRINKQLRNSFFSDCYNADLSHCQLSINSTLWDCKELKDILNTGNAWNELEQSIGLSKEDIKTLLYPFVYNIYSHSSNSITLEEWKINVFLQSNLIQKLMDSRDQFLKESRSIGSCKDAFGNHVILTRGRENSFLSLLSQSYEMYLLQDIFQWYMNVKESNTSNSFQILVYLFDGYIFSCNNRDYERISNRMKRLVEERANTVDIFTRLDAKKIISNI